MVGPRQSPPPPTTASRAAALRPPRLRSSKLMKGNSANEKDRQRKKMKKKNKSSVNHANEVDAEMFGQPNIQDATHKTSGGNKKRKKLRNNKMRDGKITRTRIEDFEAPHSNEVEDGISGKKYVERERAEDKLQKTKKKKKRKIAEYTNKVDEFNEKDDTPEQRNEFKPEGHIANSEGLNKADRRRNSKTGKSKKPRKTKKKIQSVENELSPDNLLESRGEEDAQDEVYQMSSGDEDYSKGMKKWITQYHQSRPGLKLLQERIDDFIMAHEAQEEKARVAREAQAAEGGWTVVMHHKGRKKTTDAETGIAVGSVAQAAVVDKMAKKKNKEVGIDFYRFQKREAHRNEIMMLQSKFEQDKKRIQQMRAARKFRPY